MKFTLKATKAQLVRIKLIILVLLLAIGWLYLDGHPVKALAAVGLVVIFLGGWLMVWAPAIWREYQASYKKLPKAKRTIWNQPSQAYYLANRYIVAPLLVVLGVLLIWLAFILHAIH